MLALHYLPSIDRQTSVSERDESDNPVNLIYCNLTNKVTYLNLDTPCPWLSISRLIGWPQRVGAA